MIKGYRQWVVCFLVCGVKALFCSEGFLDEGSCVQNADGAYAFTGNYTEDEWDLSSEYAYPLGWLDNLSGDPVMTSVGFGMSDTHEELLGDCLPLQRTHSPSSATEGDDASLDCAEYQDDDASPNTPTHTREAALLKALTGAWRRFADCKDEVYADKQLSAFRADILQAMHKGADIHRRNDQYRCFGQLKGWSPPSDSVAIAMFNLLVGSSKSLFTLSFQLYEKGYRQYSPEYLICLEGALVVGNVQPQKVALKNSSAPYLMRKIWMKIKQDERLHGIQITLARYQEMIESALKKSLYRHQERIISSLWRLDASGELAYLQGLMKNRVSGLKGSAGGPLTMGFRSGDAIMQFLQLHKNKNVSIDCIADSVDLPLYVNRGPRSLLRCILSLALEGAPIVYNKAAYSVTLLEEDVSSVPPRENTNLLTMLYDLIRLYGADMSREEVAYYAMRQGHLPLNAGKKRIQDFNTEVDWYKQILVIHGHIGVQCCKRSERASIVVRQSMWETVLHDKEVKTLEYYQKSLPNAQQEDVDVISTVYTLQETREMVVFFNHIQRSTLGKDLRLEREDFIKKSLQKNALRRERLWSLCENFGMQQEQDLWDAAKSLTKKTSGGRLLYLPVRALFVWESSTDYFPGDEVERVSEIYSLHYDYPDMIMQEFVHMLVQRGFPSANMYDIQRVLQGLELLGLCPIKDESSDESWGLQRRALHAMIAETSKPSAHASTESAYEISTAREVHSWLESGAMEKLWQTYLDVKDDEKAFEGLGCAEEGSCSKRQKLDGQVLRDEPEDIIARDIPALKDFLVLKGFDFSETSPQGELIG